MRTYTAKGRQSGTEMLSPACVRVFRPLSFIHICSKYIFETMTTADGRPAARQIFITASVLRGAGALGARTPQSAAPAESASACAQRQPATSRSPDESLNTFRYLNSLLP